MTASRITPEDAEEAMLKLVSFLQKSAGKVNEAFQQGKFADLFFALYEEVTPVNWRPGRDDAAPADEHNYRLSKFIQQLIKEYFTSAEAITAISFLQQSVVRERLAFYNLSEEEMIPFVNLLEKNFSAPKASNTNVTATGRNYQSMLPPEARSAHNASQAGSKNNNKKNKDGHTSISNDNEKKDKKSSKLKFWKKTEKKKAKSDDEVLARKQRK